MTVKVLASKTELKKYVELTHRYLPKETSITVDKLYEAITKASDYSGGAFWLDTNKLEEKLTKIFGEEQFPEVFSWSSSCILDHAYLDGSFFPLVPGSLDYVSIYLDWEAGTISEPTLGDIQFRGINNSDDVYQIQIPHLLTETDYYELEREIKSGVKHVATLYEDGAPKEEILNFQDYIIDDISGFKYSDSQLSCPFSLGFFEDEEIRMHLSDEEATVKEELIPIAADFWAMAAERDYVCEPEHILDTLWEKLIEMKEEDACN